MYRCLAALALVLAAAFPGKVHAAGFGLGVAAVEAGDDRLRPAASLQIAFNDAWGSKLFYYGRRQGAIEEDTFLLSAPREFGVVSASSSLRASIGPCLLYETFRVPAEVLDTNATEDIQEQHVNLGLALGVQWRPPTKSFYVSMGWDSHLFLAGEAGIFLATARRQALSISTGVVW